MLTNDDVGDLNAAVDQVFRCSVLQRLEHRDCEVVLYSIWGHKGGGAMLPCSKPAMPERRHLKYRQGIEI